jgi:hypothetical protein
VAIDKEAFLSLWKLDELPACDEGMELARRFLLRAGEAVDKLDQTDVIATRNALIRAHKETYRSSVRMSEVQRSRHPRPSPDARELLWTNWKQQSSRRPVMDLK